MSHIFMQAFQLGASSDDSVKSQIASPGLQCACRVFLCCDHATLENNYFCIVTVKAHLWRLYQNALVDRSGHRQERLMFPDSCFPDRLVVAQVAN